MPRVNISEHVLQTYARTSIRKIRSMTVSLRLTNISLVRAGTIRAIRAWALMCLKKRYQWPNRDRALALVMNPEKSSSQLAVSCKSNMNFHSNFLFLDLIVTPGPGTYIAPSAFGIYVGEKALIENEARRDNSVPRTGKRRNHEKVSLSLEFENIKKLYNNNLMNLRKNSKPGHS